MHTYFVGLVGVAAALAAAERLPLVLMRTFGRGRSAGHSSIMRMYRPLEIFGLIYADGLDIDAIKDHIG